MTTWMRTVPALAMTLGLAIAGLARADATIEGELEAAVFRGSKFVVQADVTMSNPGTVTLAGVIGAEPFELVKRFKTKAGKTATKHVKFVIDPKRYGLRDLTDTLVLQAQMIASETDQAEPAVVQGGAALPPPLVVVPGTGNELSKGAYQPFVDALNDNAGGPWITRGRHATAVTYYYKSLSVDASPQTTLEKLGEQIAKRTLKLDKQNKLFARVDMIGHSLGGVVIRQAMVPAEGMVSAKPVASLAGKVRQVFFLGAPQSGTPVAYLAEVALQATKDLPDAGNQRVLTLEAIKQALVGGVDNPSAEGLAGLLLTAARKSGQNPPFLGVVELFLPTYAFADVPGSPGPDRVDVTQLPFGPTEARLSALNSVDPDPGTTYHALHYSSVAGSTGDVTTVAALDLQAFLAGGGTDLSQVALLEGPGDGVAPQDSTLMTSHPAWNAVLRSKDLGAGAHSPPDGGGVGYLNDPFAIGYILTNILNVAP